MQHDRSEGEEAAPVSFDIGYLLAEIEELKRLAEGRYGTLAYILELAAIEARLQMKLQREAGDLSAGPWA
jgi:hypothetical protein